MTATSIDRLVRKEVSLGAIREMLPPQTHIGLRYAPWLDVDSDDVIFDYIAETGQEGLAPARAEDAEAELAQKDDLLFGEGKASIIDWALKDKYTASDVTRYREDLFIQQQLAGVQGQLNFNYSRRHAQEFAEKVARDDRRRRRSLDNRVEKLVMDGLENAAIVYNDGKIKFSIDFGRPSDQNNQPAASGNWGLADSDPIGDLLAVKQLMFDRYGITIDRGILSTRIVNNVWKSSRFLAAVGLPVIGGTLNTPLDPNYLGLAGYTPEGAMRIVEQATGISFEIYDAVYRSRPIGSTVTTNVRFTTDNKVILLPSEGSLGEIDNTRIGFAKTLTSPHPEGNWQSGWYEWEDVSKDPWLHVRGTGVKAFPVFPYMEYTYTMQVLDLL